MFTSYSLPLSLFLSLSLSHSSSLLTPLFLLYSTRSARAFKRGSASVEECRGLLLLI